MHLDRGARRRACYLVAWEDGVALGHALLKLPGAEGVSAHAERAGCAEVEDLFVVEERRREGIGSTLLEACEREAQTRGADSIGLGVGVTNRGARRLYERNGYADSGQGVFTSKWRIVDDDGAELTGREQCAFLVKRLER